MQAAEKNTDTRSRILDAARRIAADKGLSSVTVRSVSEAAGVGMGTLRHHFRSQRELFAELVTEAIDDRVDDSSVMAGTGPGGDRLERAISQFLPDDYSDAAMLRGWFDVYASAFARPASEYSRQLLEVGARRSHEHVRKWLVELAREGWLEVTQVDDAADMLVALSSGLLLEALTPGSPVTVESARSTLSFAARRALHSDPVRLGSLDAVARGRFTAPSVSLPVAARERPDRAVYVSNESGVFQVHAWDRSSDARWMITSDPNGAYLCAISPDGAALWSFNDPTGAEVGYWNITQFPESPAELPVAERVLDAKPGLPTGRAVGNHRAVLGVADDDGTTVWVIEDPTGARSAQRLYSNPEIATVHALDTAEQLVVIGQTDQENMLRPQIAVLRISDGIEVARIWDGPDHGLEVSAFAPIAGDSRLLMTQERGGFRRPFIWDVESDQRRELDLDLNGEIEARWYPNGAALLIAQSERGRVRLYRHEIETGALAPLAARPGWVGTGAVQQDDTIEYLWCDAANPLQHRALLLDGTDMIVSTPPGIPARSRPLMDAFLPLSDQPGESLHVLYSVPAAGRGPHPTVFMVHGGPYAADEDFYSPARAAWLDAGFAVVHVNYRGSVGYGRRWRDAIIGDPGRIAASDIAHARDWAIETGLAHPSRCVIEGWSWGGYLALLSAGLHPDAWSACIAGAPIGDYVQAYEEQLDALRAFDRELFGGAPSDKPELYAVSSPTHYAADIDCPILILHGTNDPRTPTGQVNAFVDQLRDHDKFHQVYEFDAGHGSLDTAETIRQIEAEIGFALRHLLPTYVDLTSSSEAADVQSKGVHA